ncbi:hypothetical protein [Edaphosphingomonas haloaromaticamans]|uniref:Uncharacterized protein n=1 Tax=Edaphosphingomonas haloaromaticamans TaxID=653954 RepID=A0A1S1HGE4_9SPHN|nr:hypothetical protein [Sphingomonas haloaromaticamans]OHT21118.1 hypothetical protein BHE75_03123 [Sphingomonas haloaromaticamans]
MDRRWREVTIQIPDLASFDDEALERHFPERDGRWSAQTRTALGTFGVDKLDLDENWASVWPGWECPACRRKKPELFRLTGNGVLLARLDIHHDHLEDVLKERLRTRTASDWINHVRPEVRHFEKLGSKLFARFAPSLVCIDCNAADGRVKNRWKQIPKDFSFRPSEIGQFVKVRPNAEHVVDEAVALQIFEAEREDFLKRGRFIDMFFDIITQGEMPQERGNLPLAGAPSPLGMMAYLHNAIRWSDREQYGEISRDLDAFTLRSVSRAGVASNGAKRKPQQVKIPSPEEIAAHDGGGAPNLWNSVDSGWRCPACRRAKAEIIRTSNNAKRKWSGKLLWHHEFILVDGYDDDEHREWIDRHDELLICGDCANILPAVKQREPSLSRSDVLFQLRDMRAVATVAPHQPHQIDWDQAKQRTTDSVALHELTGPYWDHYHAAVGCRARYRDYLACYENNERCAWGRLRSHYINNEVVDPNEVDKHLHFLMAEAERIGHEDRYGKRAEPQTEDAQP